MSFYRILAAIIWVSFAATHPGAQYHRQGCKKLLWLIGFQLKTPSGADVFYVAKNSEYIKSLKIAILSAQASAPALVPVVIMTGPSSVVQRSLKRWLGQHGASVLHHQLSFQSDMEALYKDPQWAFSQNIIGSWLRVDAPAILESLWKCVELFTCSSLTNGSRSLLEDVGRDYVLWTDPDVVFQGSIDACTLPKPQVVSVGPEFRMGWPENYGVLYFNVSGYGEVFKDLIKWGRSRSFHFEHDQNFFRAYWGEEVNTLPNGMNWKPYWGDTITAIPGPWPHENIKIVHLHGPKLSTAICFFSLCRNLPKSEVGSKALELLQQCGLDKAPNGNAVWLQTIADLLVNAYAQDGGKFYRKVQKQSQEYISSDMLSDDQ